MVGAGVLPEELISEEDFSEEDFCCCPEENTGQERIHNAIIAAVKKHLRLTRLSPWIRLVRNSCVYRQSSACTAGRKLRATIQTRIESPFRRNV